MGVEGLGEGEVLIYSLTVLFGSVSDLSGLYRHGYECGSL